MDKATSKATFSPISSAVTDLNDKNPIEINKLFSRKFIPVEHNQIPTPEIVSNWNHLEKVGMEIPSYQPDLEIGLLK